MNASGGPTAPPDAGRHAASGTVAPAVDRHGGATGAAAPAPSPSHSAGNDAGQGRHRRRRPIASGPRARDDAATGLLSVAVVAVLAAVGGAGFTAAFALDELRLPLAVAAGGGAAASAVVTGVARRRLVLSTLAAVVVLAGGALVACGAAPPDVWRGMRDGVHLVLTSAVPMAPDPVPLVVPFVLTGVAAFLGAEIAQRSEAVVTPVLPSIVALAVGLAFGTEGRDVPTWLPLAWVAVVGVLVAARRPRPGATAGVTAGAGAPGAPDGSAGGTGAGDAVGGRRASAGITSGHLVALVPLVALVVAAAAWAGPRLPGAGDRDRFTLRDLVDQPAEPRRLANPLVLVTALQDGPDDPVFVGETSARIGRWRLAVLDGYDGSEWHSTAAFVPVGHELPGPPAGVEVADGETVTQTVEPIDLGGPWLPAADRPVEVSAGDVRFDATSGTLLAEAAAPEAYEVTSVAPARDAAALADAAVATHPAAERAVELPDAVPDELRTAAEEITTGAASAYGRASAIERFLAESTADVPFRLAQSQLPTGHSIGHLRCFLVNAERCGRQGSTEQFVAAFALLARAADLPTRVVVGFESSGSAGTDEVTAHDATAWPEVALEGLGWVPFDPVPDPDVTSVPPPSDVAGGGGPPDERTTTTPARADDDTQDGEAVAGTTTGDGGSGPLPWVVGGALVALVALALPAVIRMVRRRRRRRGAPDARVAGAWAEAVDGLSTAGLSLSEATAVTDVVRAGRARMAETAGPLEPLGDLVNRDRFARGRSTDEDARVAWELSDAFAAARRRARPVRRRIREHFAVRSAGRHVS